MPNALLIQGDATKVPLSDNSVSLTFTSPPYADARTYGIGAQRTATQWVDWMLEVVTELTRVTTGLVLINCAGVTRDRVYWPCCEGLCWEWFKRGGNLWRPAYWHRVGIPGSGGKQWLRADIEYVLCFKRDAEWLPWSDNTANGHPPKWGPGGEMSHRVSSGARINQWGHSIGSGGTAGAIDDVTCSAPRPSHIEMKPMYRRGKNGDRQNGKMAISGDEVQSYRPPTMANPGNLIRGINVGGGLLGHPLAHKNEAPFPRKLAEWFIKSWCAPGEIVLDCFSGSGTTVEAALGLGRRAIGMDLRMSQCQLAKERLNNPVPTKKARRIQTPLPDQFEMFGAATC